MSVMGKKLQAEVKMLKACGAKAKSDKGGFWFWYTKVGEETVLLMRPRSRDPKGAKLKGAIAKARTQIKVATRKSVKKYIKGEAYQEDVGLRFYGNRKDPNFRDDIRDFAKEHKLRFLVGARLYKGVRMTKEGLAYKESDDNIGLDWDDDPELFEHSPEYEDNQLLASLPSEDADFDVDAFLNEEVGGVQKLSRRMKKFMFDPTELERTPEELQESVRRERKRAMQLRARIAGEEKYLSGLDENDNMREIVGRNIRRMREQLDVVSTNADWMASAIPSRDERYSQRQDMSDMSDRKLNERREFLQGECEGLREEKEDLTLQLASRQSEVDLWEGERVKALASLKDIFKQYEKFGIKSEALAMLERIQEPPLRDSAEIEAELDTLKDRMRSLKRRNISKMSASEARAFLDEKVRLQDQILNKEDELNSNHAELKYAAAQDQIMMDGLLEKKLQKELEAMSESDQKFFGFYIDQYNDYSKRCRKANEKKAKVLKEQIHVDKTLAAYEQTQERIPLYKEARADAKKLSKRMKKLIKRYPDLKGANPRDPDALNGWFVSSDARKAFESLKREAAALDRKQKKLRKKGARMNELRELYQPIKDDWRPLQFRESEKLYTDVTDFLEEEKRQQYREMIELRMENAGRVISQSDQNDKLLADAEKHAGGEGKFKFKQQMAVVSFTAQLVAIAAPGLEGLAEVSDVAQDTLDTIDDVVGEVTDAVSELLAQSDELVDVIEGVQLAVGIYQEVKEIIETTSTTLRTVKSAKRQLEAVQKIVGVDPGKRELSNRLDSALGLAISMTDKAAEVMDTPEKMLRKAVGNDELVDLMLSTSDAVIGDPESRLVRDGLDELLSSVFEEADLAVLTSLVEETKGLFSEGVVLASELAGDHLETINQTVDGVLTNFTGLRSLADSFSTSEQHDDILAAVDGIKAAVKGVQAAGGQLRAAARRLGGNQKYAFLLHEINECLLLGTESAHAAMELIDHASSLPTDPEGFAKALGEKHRELHGNVARINTVMKQAMAAAKTEQKTTDIDAVNGMDPVQQKMMMEGLSQAMLGMVQAGIEVTAELVFSIVGNIPGLGIAVNSMVLVKQLQKFAENMSRTLENQKLRDRALDEDSPLEPALDYIQDRSARLAARDATDATATILKIAADACTISGVGAIATPALSAAAGAVTAINMVGSKIDDISGAQRSKDRRQQAHDGDELSRKEVFRDSPEYAIGAVALRATEGQPDPLALGCLETFSLSPEMVSQSNPRTVQKYLRKKLKLDEDPTTWDDVFDTIAHIIDRITDGVAGLLTAMPMLYDKLATLLLDKDPEVWAQTTAALAIDIKAFEIYIDISEQYRDASSKLWEATRKQVDPEAGFSTRAATIGDRLKTLKVKLETARRQLSRICGKLCDLEAEMEAGLQDPATVYLLFLKSQVKNINDSIKDPSQFWQLDTLMSDPSRFFQTFQIDPLSWFTQRQTEIRGALVALNTTVDKAGATR